MYYSLLVKHNDISATYLGNGHVLSEKYETELCTQSFVTIERIQSSSCQADQIRLFGLYIADFLVLLKEFKRYLSLFYYSTSDQLIKKIEFFEDKFSNVNFFLKCQQAEMLYISVPSLMSEFVYCLKMNHDTDAVKFCVEEFILLLEPEILCENFEKLQACLVKMKVIGRLSCVELTEITTGLCDSISSDLCLSEFSSQRSLSKLFLLQAPISEFLKQSIKASFSKASVEASLNDKLLIKLTNKCATSFYNERFCILDFIYYIVKLIESEIYDIISSLNLSTLFSQGLNTDELGIRQRIKKLEIELESCFLKYNLLFCLSKKSEDLSSKLILTKSSAQVSITDLKKCLLKWLVGCLFSKDTQVVCSLENKDLTTMSGLIFWFEEKCGSYTSITLTALNHIDWWSWEQTSSQALLRQAIYQTDIGKEFIKFLSRWQNVRELSKCHKYLQDLFTDKVISLCENDPSFRKEVEKYFAKQFCGLGMQQVCEHPLFKLFHCLPIILPAVLKFSKDINKVKELLLILSSNVLSCLNTETLQSFFCSDAELVGLAQKALTENSVSLIKKLLAMGCGIHTKTEKEVTLLHIAIFNRDAGLTGQCLSNLEYDVNAREENTGCTPLMLCAMHNDTETGSAILKHSNFKSENLYATDINGWHVLHHAVVADAVGVLELLLDLKDKKLLTVKDKSCNNALHLAVIYKSQACLELVLSCKVLSVNSKNNKGETSLMLAARSGQTELVQMLLQAGAIVDLCNCKRYTAFHLAAKNGHKDCIKLLIDAGADVNCLTLMRRTPLVLATRKGQAASVSALLASGVASINKRDLRHKTAQDYAAANQFPQCQAMLAKAKVEKRPQLTGHFMLED